MDYIEKFDKLKTKVLKYILFKKRTEQEIKQKFKKEDLQILEDVIEELKEIGYINDIAYTEKAINEYMNLKNMSIKEIEYKLMTKGISKDNIENYILDNREKMLNYELNSAINIINKKNNLLEKDEIYNYLKKKGYLEESIQKAEQQGVINE